MPEGRLRSSTGVGVLWLRLWKIFIESTAVALEFIDLGDAVCDDGEDDWGTNYDSDKCHGGTASSFEFKVWEHSENKD